MAEMRTLNCPTCERPNQPCAVAEGIEEYRCRECGLVYYGPCGCDTVHEVSSGATSSGLSMPEDFHMQRPMLLISNASSVQKFPGCS
jgi:hypothetical protein